MAIWIKAILVGLVLVVAISARSAGNTPTVHGHSDSTTSSSSHSSTLANGTDDGNATNTTRSETETTSDGHSPNITDPTPAKNTSTQEPNITSTTTTDPSVTPTHEPHTTTGNESSTTGNTTLTTPTTVTTTTSATIHTTTTHETTSTTANVTSSTSNTTETPIVSTTVSVNCTLNGTHCDKESHQGLSGGGVAAIVITVLAVVGFSAYVWHRRRKAKQRRGATILASRSSSTQELNVTLGFDNPIYGVEEEETSRSGYEGI